MESERGPLETMVRFVSEFVPGSLPPSVTDAARRAVVDYLGVAIAGAVEPEVRPLLDYTSVMYKTGPATALGLLEPLVPEGAAFVNGAVGHVLDWDDCMDPLGGHPTVVVLPAVLALAESEPQGAVDLLEAYALGVEVCSAIGRCLNLTHYERGWHPTATLGIFGATVASASYLGLSAAELARALSIAASFASGIKGNFGTAVKPTQVGFAASKGIMASRLAASGLSASSDIFTGTHSFPSVFNEASSVNWDTLSGLGTEWSLVSPGLIFKRYPCCGSTHASVDGVLDLRASAGIAPDNIREIAIRVHPRRLPHVNRPRPRSGIDGKFSLQYTAAVAAIFGDVGPDRFADHQVNDPVVQDLLERVTVGELTPAEQTVVPGRTDCFAASVRIDMQDGETYSIHVPAPIGSDPAQPLSNDRLAEKFIVAVRTVLSDSSATQVFSELQVALETGTGISPLMGQLREPIALSRNGKPQSLITNAARR
jgi:2-methylcitrate dehydratase PrpD